ncbi:hypothetical protein GIB67_008156 [Kingdonia uniflora]|uniref:Uncharacterized protein n=1 Tax=Kingdonia uniflora TaxID=39325 RepID=A0A7J7NCC6_9MAGN|nr:hypothetical protein GIB67_008156 [Kingdonia uniflora]
MEYSFGLLSTLFAYGFHNENNTCYRSSRVRNTSVIARKWTDMHSMIYTWRVSQELLRESTSFCFLVTSGISPREPSFFVYTAENPSKSFPQDIHIAQKSYISPGSDFV